MQSEPADRAQRRPALPILTSLRFFAAAEVVVFHVSVGPSSAAIPEGLFRDLASGGYAAVSFFFVLSGFVLTYAHAGATERQGCNVEARRFWLLRFARLAPAYYFGLLLASPIIVANIASNAPVSKAFVGPLLVLVFLQAWWSPLALSWNFPAWSLSVECLFYALFPRLARMSAHWSRPMLFVTGYLLIVAATIYRSDFQSLTGKFPEGRIDLYFQAYFPLPYLPLFVFGIALGRQYLFGRTFSPRTHAAMLWAGIMLTVLAFADKSALPWWTHSDAILAPAFALIIFGGAGATTSVPMLASAKLVLLGEASYGMYILHVPLRFWWEIFLSTAGVEMRPQLYAALYFLMVVAVSILVFRCIETPMRRWISQAPRWRRQTSLAPTPPPASAR
jgi:peptidoglycan/LPS O-acetylase OafA/YrhL